ncbi:gelsolin, cytoplasmic-like [Zerene cesonia]|uniref:gelsolin, cytoplasmic-like n=1 Tax=Zerene cesonia TaxID=33412 RepID=UPI0018E52BAF|nr:gelsolin, cytoplasmic-like [Zerene cesonia]
MEHPAFVDAGAEAGLEIWTIDKFEPVPIDRNKYGKFYNGDSYIVLKTTGDNNSTLYYDVHFWLGSKTTQDKKGSAAIWTVTLDDQLGGKAVHHREVQGHESSSFVGYFQPAIRYLEGGNESGFNEVETNAGAEKRLLKLSGCDNMRIEEVPAEASSLTTDHCFILEVEHDIFVLMPDGAKATQRRKIISVANNLRDQEHNGRATIEIIDEFSSDDDFAMFFEALGSGSKDELMEGEESIVPFSRESMTTVYFYKVLYDDEVELDALSKPFKQNQLESDGIYILDTPCSGVYIWIGKDVDADVKKNYNDIVQKYLDVKNYPAWVNVTRVSEGSENSNFKQYFHNWQTVAASSSVRAIISEFDAGYFSSDADESANAAKYIGKSAAARGYMPDDGSGEITVYRITEEPEDITEMISEKPILYQNDVYVVQYKYAANGEDAYIVYTWVGEKAAAETKSAGREFCNKLEEELEGDVNIVKVPQGKETKHFLKLFKGKLGILYGGMDNDYSPDNFNHSYQDDGIRLFRVEGIELEEDMRIVQVPETADSLEDDDVFILETPEVVYVWNGKESNDKEQNAALDFTKTVVGDEREVMAVPQGEETDEFWAALGGAPAAEGRSGWQLTLNRRVTTPVTLTAVNVTIGGKVKFEELPPDFTQNDLSDDSVYILDGGEELYFWKGTNTPERVKAAKDKIIEEYIEDDGLDRTVDTAIVVSVKQGKEPANFKKLFSEWDDDMWDNQTSYEDLKNETKAGNTKD